MTDKEKIIIDGKKEKVNILFECNHIDDLQAYEMIKNGIEITPENAPICNFKIKIVSNTKSPYGFYTIFQKDPKKDEWEYMGIGNSGASSLITALLKAHEMGHKRISDLEKRIIKHSDEIEEYCSRLADKDHELKTLCKAFEIEYTKDEETGHIFGRSNKLLRKEQECERLKEDYAELEREGERLKSYGATLLADKNAMEIGRDDYMQRCKQLEQECEKLKKQLMQKSEVDMFFNTPIEGWSNDPCGICPHKAENEELKKEIINKNEKIKELRFSVSDLTNRLCHLNAEKSFRIVDLEQTLDEIEKELKEDIYCENQECGCDDFEECLRWTKNKILDIINKAKEEENE